MSVAAASESLQSAALEGHADTVRELLAAGADPSVSDHDGWQPLHNAMLAGGDALAVAAALIGAGASPHATTSQGYTPLHLVHEADNKIDWKVTRGVCHDGRSSFFAPALIQTLLDAGANVNAKAADGRTPLHLAAAHGASSSVMALCHANADVHAVDHSGQTPLQLASASTVDHLGRVRGLLIAQATGAPNVQGYSLCGEPALPVLAHMSIQDSDDEDDADGFSWAAALQAIPKSVPTRSRTPSPRRAAGRAGLQLPSAAAAADSSDSPKRAIFSGAERKRTALQANVHMDFSEPVKK